jgi:hypothetical protein
MMTTYGSLSYAGDRVNDDKKNKTNVGRDVIKMTRNCRIYLITAEFQLITALLRQSAT